MKAKGSLLKQEAEIEASKEEIDSFFNGVIPEFVRQGGGILSDNVKFWRFKNQINIIKKAQKVIEDSGLEKQQVPLKVLTPLIESSSLEEDDGMQEKWANLLANAATGFSGIKANYVEILKELSPLEATILDNIFRAANTEIDYEKRKTMQFDKTKICQAFSLSSDEGDLIIQNLYRLGLCQPPGSSGMMFGNERVGLQTTNIFELTTLGFHFIRACQNPSINQQ
jgi:hypothetical protein